jgi:hypothetical protein
MRVIERFQITILLPILSLLMGCATGSSIEWKIAFYKPEATQTEFVTDYKECDQSARSVGMVKSGVPVVRYVVYEWLEKDRTNIYMTYNAQAEYTTTAYEKRKIFISEYEPLLKKCMEEKGWIKKEYRQRDGAVHPMFSPTN